MDFCSPAPSSRIFEPFYLSDERWSLAECILREEDWAGFAPLGQGVP